MSIEAFIEIMDRRLPTAAEFIHLCASMNVTLAVIDGKPVVSCATDKESERAFEKLITREPWRSQVIELAKLQVPDQQQIPLDGR